MHICIICVVARENSADWSIEELRMLSRDSHASRARRRVAGLCCKTMKLRLRGFSTHCVYALRLHERLFAWTSGGLRKPTRYFVITQVTSLSQLCTK